MLKLMGKKIFTILRSKILCLFQDPEVAAAFQDVSTNPANISKYQNNPKVQKVINKMATKFGMFQGGAGDDEGPGGPTGGAGAGGATGAGGPPKSSFDVD